MTKINIQDKLNQIANYWQPQIAGELNGQHIKLVKFRGEFPWHRHPNEDEMFLVIQGRFRMDLQDGPIELSEGEFLIIPRGTEHRPVAESEVSVMLFEPVGTRNTGDEVNEFTYDPNP